jgi:serine/threonine protein kinase
MVDAGTVAYMPPECFEGPAVTSPALDIWAIGLMFYAMLYGTLPFYAESESQTKQKIREGKLRFPADVPVTDLAKDVIKRMLERVPEQRIHLLEFMDLPYYSMDDRELQKHID